MSRHTSLRTTAPLLLPLALALAVGGCASPSAAAREPGVKDEEEGGAEAASLARKIEVAHLELELARLEAEQEVAQAERALVAVKVEGDKTRLEREAFETSGRARALDEARLDLDRSRGRAEDAAAELAELEAMYAEEEFATKTKELVLARGRRDLEHSRRALDLAERRMRELEGFELTGKDRDLEHKRLGAEKDLVEAEQKLAKLRLEKKIAISKAEQEIQELVEKLEKINKKKGASAEATP